MRGTVVGVLRGGPSREHDVSLKTGQAILKHLDKDLFTPRDIFIDREGQWHTAGRAVTPAEALRSLDVAFVGLHGEYGEDGEVQRLLERFGVPYTGSAPYPSYEAMHKVLAKERAKEYGVLTPAYRFIENEERAEPILHDVVRSFLQPVIVKPVRWGSSVGVKKVSGFAPLVTTVKELLSEGAGGVLIEEVIRGREATAGVLESFRGEDVYALPVVEIIPPDNDFFSYDAKYSGASREICPGNFSKAVSSELAKIARTMHEALGLRHYSRSDFIVSRKGIYYLETNTLPGMTTESLLPKSLAAVGVSLRDFFTHLLGLARR
ncbi:ATP-grasp domain-containing protein [Candidatus Parcubacteria bacterium]|nr:ATP-grasp domain-containing protein [Candidatus Parcubacteria bacterium]